MYDMKALYQARSVEDAVALRMAHPQAQIIAGGSDVLVQMREGRRAGAELISIYRLDALRGVSLEEDGTLRIGSLTSFSHITRDPLIQQYINVLGEAVDQVGGPQIRNIGTIGGNTCNGVTSADSASTLHAYDAIVADRKTVERARIAFGVAGPVPLRAETAEALAQGQPVSAELADRFAQAVKEDINPRDSWRAARDFRLHIAVESARRAFLRAVELAGGAL